MNEKLTIEPIAHIENDFDSKFGIPRQSGLTNDLISEIVFEKNFRDKNALRGLEEYTHLWLIWGFSENQKKEWSPTVRPPRLGGNKRLGVFATRSPFRPNSLGLSLVKLSHIESTSEKGTIITVTGADLMNMTPIYDIKPYLPAYESKPEAKGGISDEFVSYRLKVQCSDSMLNIIPLEKRASLISILSYDPRPSYHHDPDRIYGLRYAGYEIKFKVESDILTVCNIIKS